MQNRIQKQEEFERCWKDPSFLCQWNRARKRLTSGQKEFRDQNGSWEHTQYPEDSSASPEESEVAKTDASKASLPKAKKRGRGDPEFILPKPIVKTAS